MAWLDEPEEDLSWLPKWAEHESIAELCKRDLAFRCSVFSAETPSYQRILKRQADEWYNREKQDT
jgi:hypothetical protein